MIIIIPIVVGIVALAVGIVATMAIQKSMARTRAKVLIEEAEREAESMKKTKLLEAREEELKIIADAEKQANQRMSKVQSVEAKMKQRELQLNQQQSENQRARNENENTRTHLEAQLAVVE